MRRDRLKTVAMTDCARHRFGTMLLVLLLALAGVVFAGLALGEVTFNVFTVVAIAFFIAFLWLLFRPNKWQGKVAARSVDEA